jgi:hypothetical protein
MCLAWSCPRIQEKPSFLNHQETGKQMYRRSERDQSCKEVSQTTPSWNTPVALECEHLYSYADAHCHGGALHRLSAFHAFSSEWPYAVFLCVCVSQYIFNVIMVPCCMSSTISTSFLSQRQLLSAFWQAENVYLNLFGLFRECVCIQCFDCSLVSIFRNETQVSSRDTRTIWLRNSSPSLWYRSKKSKPKPFSAFCATREHFRNTPCAKLVIT